MNVQKINEDILCVLIHEKKTNKFLVDEFLVNRNIDSAFDELEREIQKEDQTAKMIISFIYRHYSLKKLFAKYYNYCVDLDKPYQGLSSQIEVIARKYPSRFYWFKDEEKKKKAVEEEKENLLNECRHRLIAVYLDKAYEECNKNKEIIAFSHRKVGWSTPKYKLNENFSIELKTNFGYGSVSYFYTRIQYKGLDIVPFADWIDYQFCSVYEIVRYSSKHELGNQSWYNAMTYVAEACNTSIADENLFVKEYIIEQCEDLANGLRRILTDNEFQLKGYKFLNQERGYIDLKLEGHNLIEFRGEKVSGSLGLIAPIKKFGHIIEIENHIKSIEECNLQVKPMLVKEQPKVKSTLKKLNKKKNTLEPEYSRLKDKNSKYQVKNAVLRQELIKKNGSHNETILIKEFNRENPDYLKLRKDLDEVTKTYDKLHSDILRNEKILANLIVYYAKIVGYFE